MRIWPHRLLGRRLSCSAYNLLMVKRNCKTRISGRRCLDPLADQALSCTQRRRRILDQLDDCVARRTSRVLAIADRTEFYRQAYDLITSPAAKKRIRSEPPNLTARPLWPHARRPIDAAVPDARRSRRPFHRRLRRLRHPRQELRPPERPAASHARSRLVRALLTDLSERGMLSNTIVLCAGEFGRTPRVNGRCWPRPLAARQRDRL